MSEPVAGKFLLEILTKGMYSNPKHIYREYIQNAADSIDKALDAKVLEMDEAKIHISIDNKERIVVIRDNGNGLSRDIAKIKLLSIGASDKDGIIERGFRGIGRLGGLAYAEQVQFITSAAGEAVSTVMTCDCSRLQELLRKSNHETADIMETFKAISSFKEMTEDADQHYFEVRLSGVSSTSGLLETEDVIQYIAETAPIDFDSQKFSQAGKIKDFFKEKGCPLICYKILYGTRQKPIYKLYSRSISTGKKERTKIKDFIRDVEMIYQEASDGKPLYIGWLAITEFYGALSNESIQVIRFRKGNILVGNHTTFAKCFPSEGHNANRMFAGEIHVLHDDLIPNSQRDDFEPSSMYAEMQNALADWAGKINKKYRRGTSEATSALRQLTQLNKEQKDIEEQISTGAITSDEKREQLAERLEKIERNRKIKEQKVRRACENGIFDDERKARVEETLLQTEIATKQAVNLNKEIMNADYATKNDLPSSYSRDERKLYQRIITVIDAYFVNDSKTAENLREKIKTELSVKRK